jgi:hypothetical protein
VPFLCVFATLRDVFSSLCRCFVCRVGVVLGGGLAAVWMLAVDPNVAQVAVASRSIRHAQGGAVLASALLVRAACTAVAAACCHRRFVFVVHLMVVVVLIVIVIVVVVVVVLQLLVPFALAVPGIVSRLIFARDLTCKPHVPCVEPQFAIATLYVRAATVVDAPRRSSHRAGVCSMTKLFPHDLLLFSRVVFSLAPLPLLAATLNSVATMVTVDIFRWDR